MLWSVFPLSIKLLEAAIQEGELGEGGYDA